MKKTIKLAVVAVLALGATSAFATNGSNMMATGAKATAMGGTGIGMSHGAESALVNPALITSVKDTEISFGGTIFMPTVSTDGGSGGMVSSDSDAKLNVIPEVSIATKMNDSLYLGIGMWGTAGMGTDYRTSTNPGTMNMVTNLQLMQFGVPVAYKINNFSVAVTPLLQYGALDMNFMNPMTGTLNGNGVSQNLKFGYNLGAAYTMSGLTLGATYVSQIDMEYNNQFANLGMADKLSTPATIGAGVSYAFGANTIAFDYKQIKWEDAKGYQDFNWKNQSVMALGYQYTAKTWAGRIGYNYAKSPIEAVALGTTPASMTGATLANMFNLVGFPAIVESHMTVGGSYNLSERTAVDLAYVYSPETAAKFDIMTAGGPSTIETKHSQQAVSAQLSYKF